MKRFALALSAVDRQNVAVSEGQYVYGKATALDGWVIEWDLRESPAQIDTFNDLGTPQHTFSGAYDERHVKGMVQTFLQDHNGQMALF